MPYLQMVEIKILSKPTFFRGVVFLYLQIVEIKILSKPRKCDKDKQKYLLLDSYLVIKKTYLPHSL